MGSMRGVGAIKLGRPSIGKMNVALKTANKFSYKNSQILKWVKSIEALLMSCEKWQPTNQNCS